MAKENKIVEAILILGELGMPKAQHNERSALCLLALLNLTKKKSWNEAKKPLMGITPMMEFALKAYRRKYAPNTRETFRRQTMHQVVAAGIALYNPDDPGRPVNSPKAVYQIEPGTLGLCCRVSGRQRGTRSCRRICGEGKRWRLNMRKSVRCRSYRSS